MRTQVGIIGAGPAGLFLSHLLQRAGIDCVVLEARSRDYVENRVRAGVLEQHTVDLMDEIGAGERLHRESMVDRSLDIRFLGHCIHMDMETLSGGKVATIYGQQEVVKDLIAARVKAGGAAAVRGGGASRSMASTASGRPSATAIRAKTNRSNATLSPAATAFTASAGRRSPSVR